MNVSLLERSSRTFDFLYWYHIHSDSVGSLMMFSSVSLRLVLPAIVVLKSLSNETLDLVYTNQNYSKTSEGCTLMMKTFTRIRTTKFPFSSSSFYNNP